MALGESPEDACLARPSGSAVLSHQDQRNPRLSLYLGSASAAHVEQPKRNLVTGDSNMAANISFFNGRKEFATALQPAWHDPDGSYVLDEIPDSETMINAAHLDWHVDLRPVCNQDGQIIEGYSTTVRTDTGTHLGIMSDSYRVVQNVEAFKFLDGLLQDGIMKYESAGALRDGRTVFALARMPSVDEIAEGDSLNRYVLWLNSHDATGSLFCIPTSVRVVCSNTAALAIRGQRGIRHIGDMDSKLKKAHELLSQADQQFTDYRDKAKLLATRRYSNEQANQYIDTLLPVPETEGRACTIRERKVEAIRTAFRSERNQLPSIRGTYWSLYNSVSEAVDHGKFYAFKGNGRTRSENRMQSVLMGPGADFKAKAFDLAVAMAT
jgi:phage/plasmid-like protein (TIGR03299 family)